MKKIAVLQKTSSNGERARYEVECSQGITDTSKLMECVGEIKSAPESLNIS